MSPGVVVGAAGVGVVDVGIVAGVGVDEGIDSTTPSSWTVGHGGDVALGGLSLMHPPCGGEGEREWTTRLVLLLLYAGPNQNRRPQKTPQAPSCLCREGLWRVH